VGEERKDGDGWRLASVMANEVENEDELSKSSGNQFRMSVDENIGCRELGIGDPKIIETSWTMMTTVETMRKRDRLPAFGVGSDCGVDFDRLEVDLGSRRLKKSDVRRTAASRTKKRMTDSTSFMFLFHSSLFSHLAGRYLPTGRWDMTPPEITTPDMFRPLLASTTSSTSSTSSTFSAFVDFFDGMVR